MAKLSLGRGVRRTIAVALSTMVGATLALVLPATGAFAAAANTTYLQIKLNGTETGQVMLYTDFIFGSSGDDLYVNACVKDTLANGMSPYVKFVAYSASGSASHGMIRNTGGNGTQLCSAFVLNEPVPEDIGFENIRVEKGNCDGSTCTRTDYDWVPSPGFAATWWAPYHTWQTDVKLRWSSTDNDTCVDSPSTAHCPDTLIYVQPSNFLRVRCQTMVTTTGGNPYWLLVDVATTEAGLSSTNKHGWIPSYYLNYAEDWVDKTAYCGAY